MKRLLTLVLTAAALGPATARAADDIPKPVPLTRPEMKQALEALKHRRSRLPLPLVEPREDGRPPAHNGLMRQHYLPAELRGGGFSRRPDPRMTFDYRFATMLFWIASRANNCHY